MSSEFTFTPSPRQCYFFQVCGPFREAKAHPNGLGNVLKIHAPAILADGRATVTPQPPPGPFQPSRLGRVMGHRGRWLRDKPGHPTRMCPDVLPSGALVSPRTHASGSGAFTGLPQLQRTRVVTSARGLGITCDHAHQEPPVPNVSCPSRRCQRGAAAEWWPARAGRLSHVLPRRWHRPRPTAQAW